MFCANNASNVTYQLHIFAVIINNLVKVQARRVCILASLFRHPVEKCQFLWVIGIVV